MEIPCPPEADRESPNVRQIIIFCIFSLTPSVIASHGIALARDFYILKLLIL